MTTINCTVIVTRTSLDHEILKLNKPVCIVRCINLEVTLRQWLRHGGARSGFDCVIQNDSSDKLTF